MNKIHRSGAAISTTQAIYPGWVGRAPDELKISALMFIGGFKCLTFNSQKSLILIFANSDTENFSPATL
jgi:hypothetical protein